MHFSASFLICQARNPEATSCLALPPLPLWIPKPKPPPLPPVMSWTTLSTCLRPSPATNLCPPRPCPPQPCQPSDLCANMLKSFWSVVRLLVCCYPKRNPSSIWPWMPCPNLCQLVPALSVVVTRMNKSRLLLMMMTTTVSRLKCCLCVLRNKFVPLWWSLVLPCVVSVLALQQLPLL